MIRLGYFGLEGCFERFGGKRYGVCGGGVAQLGERLVCIQEVIGSSPFTSTNVENIEQFLFFDNCIFRKLHNG